MTLGFKPKCDSIYDRDIPRVPSSKKICKGFALCRLVAEVKQAIEQVIRRGFYRLDESLTRNEKIRCPGDNIPNFEFNRVSPRQKELARASPRAV